MTPTSKVGTASKPVVGSNPTLSSIMSTCRNVLIIDEITTTPKEKIWKADVVICGNRLIKNRYGKSDIEIDTEGVIFVWDEESSGFRR